MNPSQIESEIVRLSEELEKRTDALAEVSQRAAKAEHEQKKAEALAIIKLAKERLTADVRKAMALATTADAHETRLISAAERDSTQEACRSLRAQLSALQSLLRNTGALT